MSTATLSAKKAYLLERWKEILVDPELDQYDDNYCIETDADGHVIMSPRPPNSHNRKAYVIARMLEERLGGCASTETRILTEAGVKAADAIWLSINRRDELQEDVFVQAPEICIEVLSPSNTRAEVEQKRALYLAAGAREVWVCDRSSEMSFFDSTGQLERSKLCPNFPTRLDFKSPPSAR